MLGSSTGDGRNRHILVVEDNPADAFLLEELLSEVLPQPYELMRAASLSEAVEKAPLADLTLLDMGLPDSFGLETLTRFREACPDTRVVVLSGLDDRDMARKALAEGADDYLVKGEEDVEAIPRLLDGPATV